MTKLWIALGPAACILAPAVVAAEIAIDIPSGSAPVSFAATKLEDALREKGATPVRRAKSADIVVRASGAAPDVVAGGFEIRRTRSGGRAITSVLGADDSGAMYGVLELADQVRTGGLAGIRDKKSNPRFPFRAIKFNLPWSSYRVGEALQLHTGTVRDLKFWQRFLDMMAENRFNVLSLWALHPWPYMIRAANFPKACSFTDAELADWQAFWHKLFAMAKARGIEVYMVNWNVFVSYGYRDAYDKNAIVDGPDYHGPSHSTEDVRRYNRESVTQVLNEYPDLAGIGITVGERMDEMDVYKQVEWVEDVYFRGIRAANRPAKFIYRAALKNNDPAFVRKSIEKSGLPAPVWVELKFNWSHGHSTPTLVHAHGGGTGEPYWNPPPANHKMTWMMRNEDFFMLRWGQPEFIRDHIEKNGGAHTGGYFVGSECYIPAREYMHRTDSPHLTWQYSFERQWLYYQEWGRLLYDPATPDAVFEAAFDRRYGPGAGKSLLRAYSLASRMPLRLASLYFSTWDYSLYSEGFLAPSSGTKNDNSPFISIDELIDRRTLDPNYVSIKDYAAAANGGGFPETRITPPKLATALEADGRAALAALQTISTARRRDAATLECEMDDARTWAMLSLYMAAKVRAGVALQTARIAGDQSQRAEAVKLLEQAAAHWEELSRITASHFRPDVPLMHLQSTKGRQTFAWSDYAGEVKRDIQIAREK